MLDWLRSWFRNKIALINWPELEDMPAEMKDWPSDVLMVRLVEAAMTMGLYMEWSEFQANDRQRYIAAATLVEDAADELEGRLGALAERVLGEVEAIVAESIESSAEEMEKEATVAQDYVRALEAVGVAARAALRDFEGVWLSQRMRVLGNTLEVMDKARLKFFKEQR